VKFPQLAAMVKGLLNALSAIMWGVLLLVITLTVFGVLAVQFIHPLNLQVAESGIYDGCARCEHAFESVSQSMLTFTQQIVAGDSWGVVTVPIIEAAPLSAVYFLLVFISVHLAILNVILAVIVDSALKVSQDDAQEVIKKKTAEFDAVKAKLKQICHEMDADESHDLSLQELLEGFDSNIPFRNELSSMDVKKDDMHAVFGILDSDNSGKVNYDEFIEELHKMKTHDAHTLLVFIKFYVVEVRKLVLEQLRVFRDDVTDKIQMQGTAAHPAPGAEKLLELLREEKKLAPALAVQAEPVTELGEEFRQLRAVISEDLVNSMREMARKSESHTRLLASIAGDAVPTLHGDRGAEREAAVLIPRLRTTAANDGQSGQNGQAQLRSAWSDFRAGPLAGTPDAKRWGLQGCCSTSKATDNLTINLATPKV